MPPIFDDQDQAIKDFLLTYWNKKPGPRVGDFVELEDGTLHRFTHDWGDTIQTTSSLHPAGGSFYFALGYCSYSGGLDPGVARSRLIDTGRTKEGHVWFFHHDQARAHNGVTTTIPCRVYALKPQPKEEPMTTLTPLTANDVYNQAPLGSLIRYYDGNPEPPKRFNKKHAAWRRHNGIGTLISKQAPDNSASYSSPGRFTLHHGNFASTIGPTVIIHCTYLLSSKLNFDILQRPAPGSVRILRPYDDYAELLHLAPTPEQAQAWLRSHPNPDAILEAVPQAA